MKNIGRLLKNNHLLCCAHRASLRRTMKYASFLTISRALHPDVFDQSENNYFFNNLLVPGFRPKAYLLEVPAVQVEPYCTEVFR